MKITAPKSENLEGRRVKKNQDSSFPLRNSSARAGAFLGALPQAGMVLGLGPGSQPQRGDPYRPKATPWDYYRPTFSSPEGATQSPRP